jgi:uncharacterized protein
MKRISAAVMICLMITTNSICQTKNQKSKSMEAATKKASKEVVQRFFSAFGNGDFNGVVNSFHDSCTVIAVRDSQRGDDQIYGTYKGKEGAKTFLSTLGKAFDTKAFSVENIIGEDHVSFANGKFTHVVKSSGKEFLSDWALMCIIKDDKIFEYHFYEDSERFLQASK